MSAISSVTPSASASIPSPSHAKRGSVPDYIEFRINGQSEIQKSDLLNCSSAFYCQFNTNVNEKKEVAAAAAQQQRVISLVAFKTLPTYAVGNVLFLVLSHSYSEIKTEEYVSIFVDKITELYQFGIKKFALISHQDPQEWLSLKLMSVLAGRVDVIYDREKELICEHFGITKRIGSSMDAKPALLLFNKRRLVFKFVESEVKASEINSIASVVDELKGVLTKYLQNPVHRKSSSVS